MSAGSNPAAGRWPSVPYSARLSVSATLPARTVHGRGGRRVAGGCGFGRRVLFGIGRGGQVGVGAPVQQDAFHVDLLDVEPDAAGLDFAVGEAHREFGHGGGGVHPEGGVQDRDLSDVERPRQRSGAVGFLRRGRFRQVEEDVAVGEGDPGDVGPLGPGGRPGFPRARAVRAARRISSPPVESL